MARWCAGILLVALLFCGGFFLLSPSVQKAGDIDRLNDAAYAFHYRNIDSVAHYCDLQQRLSDTDYRDGRAECLNNMAFVSIVQMDYKEAELCLNRIPEMTDNQIEMLVCYVQQMRLCQRRSHNREFYEYRERAVQALNRINEERHELSDRQQRRLAYAESELAIVTSTYYYYVGLEQESVEAIRAFPEEARRDTAQWLNYLYNVGAGGIITDGSQQDISQQEFDCLIRCFQIAHQHGYPFFAANAMEALAEHLVNPQTRQQLVADNAPAIRLINPGNASLELLPLRLAEQALDMFRAYGDVYQTAGAYRTLASCSHALGDESSALYYLEQALADSAINQAPDLVASIREQLSVAYSAIDDKEASDYNRNVYLDLQEQTRQDRWLEARAGQLDEAVARLNKLLIAIGMAIVLLVAQLFIYRRWRKGRYQSATTAQDDQQEEIRERLAVCQLHIQDGERRHLEQRAKVSLANSIIPFIDRMLYTIRHLPQGNDRSVDTQVQLEYICELTDKINELNEMLTQWIQLRQGQLSLHIETFPLQPLLDIVAKGVGSFALKGVELSVHPTAALVKADRVLTLFMLNTLADNARKFTDKGGKVDVSAQEYDDYVEVSVADTGRGMDEEQLASVFSRKQLASHASHGFGLLNCKGIIEKYRKTSRLFSVCQIAAESRKGEGSRFYFRLPKGVARLLLCLLMGGASVAHAQNSHLTQASVYADSAYYSNIQGTYRRTLAFADSCRQALNAYYRQQRPQASDTLLMMGDLSLTPPEVLWLHDSVQVNYDILLTMRNESAVAALALHEWPLYSYNNKLYTQLFKELSADVQLAEYCRRMQQSQANHTIAIVLLVLILLVILLAVAAQTVQSMRRSARQQQEQQDSIDMLEDELHRAELEEGRLHVSNQVLDNCLSALKHETMYYPSRIRQLVDMGETASLPEAVEYYRELYGILSQQARSQVESIKLRLKPLHHELLGDENLIDYLFDLLRKQSGQREKLQVTYAPKDERHIVCRVPMPRLRLTAQQAHTLFAPEGRDGDRIPFLLCRQIVRDHGEATGCRACGIWAETDGETTTIVIILPRQICKTSK